jgi:type IV pilus assembly protein PilP
MKSVRIKLTGLAVFLWMLAGCTQQGDMGEIEQKLQDIRSKPNGQLEEPPQFSTYENFVYKATLLRSPFQKPLEEEVKKAVQLSGVKVTPDLNRNNRGKGLEEFSLESLMMVGTIRKDGKDLYALILDPKNGITRVLPGMYMGRNDGKVLSITERKIELQEIISDGVEDQDGNHGWIERPRSIVLREPQ